MREYRIGNLTYQLDEADAARLGATPVDVETKAVTPRNKARAPRSKAKADQ